MREFESERIVTFAGTKPYLYTWPFSGFRGFGINSLDKIFCPRMPLSKVLREISAFG